MNFGVLSSLVDSGISTRAIAREQTCSQANVRYWIRKYGLKTRAMADAAAAVLTINCRLCGNLLKDKRRRRCGSCNTRVRRMRAKLTAIAYLGGKCNRCSWQGLPAGYDFHHKSGEKDFVIGSATNKAWAVIKAELDKCELLCRCCHAIHHSKHDDELLMKEVAEYNSGLLLMPG